MAVPQPDEADDTDGSDGEDEDRIDASVNEDVCLPPLCGLLHMDSRILLKPF